MGILSGDTFGSNTVLGLQVTGSFIAAVQVRHALRGPEIEKANFRELHEEEETAGALAGFLDEAGFDAGSVVTSLPSSRAALRELELAIRSPKKLQKVIKYQVEPLVPFPIEGSVVDYIPAGPNGRVLAAAVEKHWVTGLLSELKSGGIDPDCVTLDDLALAALFRRFHSDEEGSATALMRMGPERDGIQILHRGATRLVRSLPQGKDGLQAVWEILRLHGIEHPNHPVEKILLTGPDSIQPEKRRELNARTGIPVEPWQPFSGIKANIGVLDGERQARLSVPLGLAMAGASSRDKAFNLRREEFTKRTGTSLRRQLIVMGLGLFLLGGLTIFNLHRKTTALEREYLHLKTEITEILRSTFPEAQVIPGREAALMEQKIAEQRGQFGWLESLTSKRSVLDLLVVLTDALSNYKDVTVDNISVEGREIHLDGRASSFQTVDRVKETLEKEKAFLDVKLLSAKADKGKGAVRFSFVLEEAP